MKSTDKKDAAVHIFNVKSVVAHVKRNRREKNLYEKVNMMFKGAHIGSDDLRDEVAEIIQHNCSALLDTLRPEGGARLTIDQKKPQTGAKKK